MLVPGQTRISPLLESSVARPSRAQERVAVLNSYSSIRLPATGTSKSSELLSSTMVGSTLASMGSNEGSTARGLLQTSVVPFLLYIIWKIKVLFLVL